ncbi:MAG: hypothetical protein EOO03_17910 [Chitinophagaceae bacterium]|nr:MAG: hypothetical protein EOO03_17910 [Chitinophagaceae bacterium]
MVEESEYLLAELPKSQTRDQLSRIRNWVLEKPKRFDVLVKLYLSGNYRITQRAVRIISQIADIDPELVQLYLVQIVGSLSTNPSDAVKRNVVRLLQKVDIPQGLQGKVSEHCFAYLQNPKEAIAVRAFSVSVLARICLAQPELTREFLLLMDDILPFAGPGISVRIRDAKRKLQGPGK